MSRRDVCGGVAGPACKGGRGRPSTLQSEAGADSYTLMLAVPLPWRTAGIDFADALNIVPVLPAES